MSTPSSASQTLLFPSDAQQGTLLLVVAGLTMVVGVLGAIAQDDLRRMLSFHIVSHIGYMIFGLALFTLAGIAGAVFYIVHHIVVKSSLFLVAGLAEFHAGTDRLSRLGGMVRSAPTIAVLFALPAMSIAGIPPFSGFVGKFALVDAGIRSEKWVIVAVSLTVSLLTAVRDEPDLEQRVLGRGRPGGCRLGWPPRPGACPCS